MDLPIISAERAAAEGVTPLDLEVIAKWHDARAAQCGRKSSKRAANQGDALRHREMAARLREVATDLAILQGMPSLPKASLKAEAA